LATDSTSAVRDGEMREHWVITGAGSGIGHGLAARLAAEDLRVTACVGRDEALASLAAIAAERGESFSTLVFDVSDDAMIRVAAEASSEPVDVLVACAGVFGSRRTSRDMDFDEALDIFSVNALGPLRTTRAFLPRLLGRRNPRVVLVSSELGSMSMAGSSNLAYRASKSALNKLTQGLAADLRVDGVIVIALEPGWVRTPMGGPDAPLSVEESVSGIVSTIRGLTLDRSGRFLDHQNQEVSW
jgi:NAD(P)-dependent dehydrogenase (short-subunit alcohol dehydrogenase family)